MHHERYLYTRPPPITTSHRRTQDDIVCQPQLHQGREPAFFSCFLCMGKKEYLTAAVTNSDTLAYRHSSRTTHASPSNKFLEFPPPARHSHSHPFTYLLHMPFSISPCGHLNCPCCGVGRSSIFTPSPPQFHPSSQCYASFICGTA